MAAKKIVCICPRSFDVALCDELPESDWEVHVARDLNAARRLLGE